MSKNIMKESIIVKHKKMTLCELREILKMSQSDLAKALGVTQATIARWESGDRKIALDVSQVQTLIHLLSKIGKDFFDLEENPVNRYRKPLQKELCGSM